MDKIYNSTIKNFEKAVNSRNRGERKIGAELKFPLVNPDGSAAGFEKVCALWAFLESHGWKPDRDSLSGRITGCNKAGKSNHTVASCETGYCKTEFSLACVSDLFELQMLFSGIKKLLLEFSKKERVFFLGYGIQPLTRPGEHLLMKKNRTSFWDKVFGANRVLPMEDGDDVNIFTVNASSHVHIDIFTEQEAVSAVNVLNGFSGAQIALTAHSNVWKGRIDPEYKCVNEMFWDWWMPEGSRVGVPDKPFKDIRDYIDTIGGFSPVYIKRGGKPLLLPGYKTFADYYNSREAAAVDIEGKEVAVVPEESDIDTHNTCYWYNARLTRYHTVENRVNDQQPPDELFCVAAVTLGLASALQDAEKELLRYRWETLKAARTAACRSGLAGQADGILLKDMAGKIVELAKYGLEKRKKGEEVFLKPLEKRLKENRCPADETEEFFLRGGVESIVEHRKL